MNIEILNTLEIKKKEIDYHNKKYHSDDNPEITDFEFDQLCKEYDDIIIANPEFYFLERSEVGSFPSNQFEKYTHYKPMSSLNNAFSFADVSEFIDKIYKFFPAGTVYEEDSKSIYTGSPSKPSGYLKSQPPPPIPPPTFVIKVESLESKLEIES